MRSPARWILAGGGAVHLLQPALGLAVERAEAEETARLLAKLFWNRGGRHRSATNR